MRHSVVSAVLAIAALALSGDAEAQVAYTTKLVNLRAGPDRSYPVVTVLAAAQLVEVQGCLGDYRWCDVIAGFNRGWVYAGNLSYLHQNSYVPLATYGPVIGVGIVAFAVDDYWGRHYLHRPWYPERHRWHAPQPLPPHRARPVAPPPGHVLPGPRPQQVMPPGHLLPDRRPHQAVPRPPHAAPPAGAPPGLVQRPPRQWQRQPPPGGPGRPPPGGQRHYP